MVMINAPDESPPKESGKAKDKTKTKSSKAKAEVGSSTSPRRQSTVARPTWSPDFIKETQADGRVSYKQIKSHSKNISHDDDVVMVDGGNAGDPLVTSGPDDMAFVDHPPGLKRSNTARKSGGFFGSFFGGRASQVVEPDKERPRSTTLTDAEDQGLPIRTRTSKRKSKAVDAEGFYTDAPAETDAAPEARLVERRAKRDAKDKAEEAERADREARRKERRDREKADLDARRGKARDRVSKEQEDEDRRREERHARRAAKEAKREDGTHDDVPMTDAVNRRAERRKLRENHEGEDADARASKEQRKKQYEQEEDELRRRREEKKPTKDRDLKKDKERESSSRKSKASALVEEYHQSRSGSSKGHLNHAPDTGKTNSWIQDQVYDPPDLPPVEGTILDGSNEKPRKAGDDGAEGRKERKKSRKSIMEKSVSGASDERRDKRSSRRYVNEADNDYPIMSFDGRPEMKRTESKRKSFLGGLF
jgi:hypothetical protein